MLHKFYPLTSLISVVLKRLRNHLGLSLSSLIGIVSILSLVVCVPVFTNGVLSRVLKEQLTEKALLNHRSLFSLHVYYPDNEEYLPIRPQIVGVVADHLRSRLEGSMGLKVSEIVTEMSSRSIRWTPVKMQSTRPVYKELYLSFTQSATLASKVKIVEGRWPLAEEAVIDPIPVAVLEEFADAAFLNVGDIFQREGMSVEIVGIFRAIDPSDPAWFYDPETTFRNSLWVPVEYFMTRLPTLLDRAIIHTSWYVVVAEDSLRFSRSMQYTHQVIRLENELRTMLPGGRVDYSPLDMLEAYEDRLNALVALFYAAGAPMLVLAVLFIGLVASIAIHQYEGETAVMAARGGSAGMMVGLNLCESLVLILLSIPIALLTGWLAAGLMGQTELFLKFTQRAGFSFSLRDVNLAWLSLAALAVILARLAPMAGSPRPSLLSLKGERTRSVKKPVWERAYFDLMLLIPGIYAYLAMRARARIPLQATSGGSTPGHPGGYDPLMFLAASIFAISMCMLLLRLLPFFLRLISMLAERLPQASIYLAIQEITRRPREHASAMLLIMISLGFSIFSASMARTLDRWLRDSQYYLAGSDLAIKEYALFPDSGQAAWTVPAAPSGNTSRDRVVETIISLEQHTRLPEILSATYAGKWPGRYSFGSFTNECTILGIDRLTFQEAAFYRQDFASEPLGSLLNALVANPHGVLLPESLAEDTGLQVGDRIQVTAIIGVVGEAVTYERTIAGLYRYFPTVYPGDKPTLIADLDELFGGPDSITGVEVWMRLVPGAQVPSLLDNLRRTAARDALLVEVHGNAVDAIAQGMARPEWTGLFGVLNVGFLITGLLPGIAFILYSFASLRNRLAQFGILQALGLSTRQASGSLLLEQVLLMVVALLGGAGVGLLTSLLFLPFLQVAAAGGQASASLAAAATGAAANAAESAGAAVMAASASGSPVPPFLVLLGWKEAAWLCAAFILVFLCTLAGMMVALVRMKIFQAVKMGETI